MDEKFPDRQQLSESEDPDMVSARDSDAGARH